MDWNRLHDPFVEAGYYGYSVRAIARRLSDNTFVPMLEIRDFRRANGERLYEQVFDDEFTDADSAIQLAMGKGYQIIDDLLDRTDMDERIENMH